MINTTDSTDRKLNAKTSYVIKKKPLNTKTLNNYYTTGIEILFEAKVMCLDMR